MYQMGEAHCMLEVGGGVVTGGDVVGECGIHRRHIDRSGRQRVGRLVDGLTRAVETEGKSPRLKTVWATTDQQDSSLCASDFEDERWVGGPVRGDVDGRRAATARPGLYPLCT